MQEPFLLSNGSPYSVVGSTGTMAAALAANAVVFAMRATANTANQNPPRGPIVIDGMRLTFTAIVASGTPVLAGRALGIYKGTDATQALPLSGTLLTPIAKHALDAGADSGLEGARIATTAGLTVAGFTRGAAQLGVLDLVGLGAAGARVEKVYSWAAESGHMQLDPGEVLVISNPAIFDAALTWQLTVELDYHRRDFA